MVIGGLDMPRVKKLNIKMTYGDTGWVVNDLGEDKSPRFELYNTNTKQIKSRGNNPLTFDSFMFKETKEGWVWNGRI